MDFVSKLCDSLQASALPLDAGGIDSIESVVAAVDASPDESQVPLAAGVEVDRACA